MALPVVVKLPLPKLAYPATFIPEEVIVTILEPPTPTTTLPPLVGIFTLLVPFACGPIKLPPVILPVPVITPVPNPRLPTLALPVVVNAPLPKFA